MPNQLLMQQEREQIVLFSQKLVKQGLTVGTGGNISIFDSNLKYMAITPTGIDYFTMQPEDVVVMDLDGNKIDGHYAPSSEYLMHAYVYKTRNDAHSMIHTHALYATTVSCLRKNLPAADYLVAHAGGKDIKCATYATYGTEELAQHALAAMVGRKAVLLANHGLNVIGDTLQDTFERTEQIEFCARLFWQASAIGHPIILPDEEMTHMVHKFQGYGKQPEQ